MIYCFLCLLLGCSSEKHAEVFFSFEKENPDKTVSYFDTDKISGTLRMEGTIDSVQLILNGSYWQTLLTPQPINLPQEKHLMGHNTLQIKAYKDGMPLKRKLISYEVLPKLPPHKLSYEVIKVLPHSPTSFTQGLLYHKGKIYESTGQYGASELHAINLQTGDIEQKTELARRYFAEGLAVLDEQLYQLTWQSGVAFVYDLETLKKTETLRYGSHTKEGWGLTTIENQLLLSNGTHQLLFFTPDFTLTKYIEVYSHKGKVAQLNELEYVAAHDAVYANIWLENKLVVINPKNGKVEAELDLTSILSAEQRAQLDLQEDVLNGIAYREETDTFFVTGKNWPWLFEIKINK